MPKQFDYAFIRRESPLPDFPVRVDVEKRPSGADQSSAPLSTCQVWRSEDGNRTMGDCPSARFGGNGGRCKHTEWVEEWVEIQAATFGEPYRYSTEKERFIKEEAE